MSIPSSNPQTFGWIKSALGQSMLQAMKSVAHAEDSVDRPALDLVSKNLHQIQGSLQMVELEAAGMFARDLELLSEQFSKLSDEDRLDDPSNTLSVLKRGLERLKNYLAGIENQTPQSPLALVDDINAVRAITLDKKITRYELFDPPLELNAYISGAETLDFPEDKRRNLLFNLRNRYRQALLSWLNDNNRDQSLTTMAEMISHFQRVNSLDIFQQLWWVAAGFVESVLFGKIDEDPNVKAQFAKIDYEMSRVGDHNWGSIASSPPDELLRQMLFYIGDAVVDNFSVNHGETEISQRVSQISDQLGLVQWFDFETDALLQDEFASLVQNITNLVTAFDIEHLDQIQNNTDLYFSDDLEAEKVEKYFASLDELLAVSKQFDVEDLNGFIEVLVTSIKSVDIDSGYFIQSGADIKIASALLMLKDTFVAPSVVSQEWKQSIADRSRVLTRLIDSEFDDHDNVNINKQQALGEFAHAKTRVIDEVNLHLSKMETVISEIADADFDQSKLTLVSEHLSEVASWVEMLNGDQLAVLVTSAAKKFEQLQSIPLKTSAENREDIVFVIASIGVCAEQLGQANHQPIEIIERAQKTLDELVPDASALEHKTDSTDQEDRESEDESKAADGVENESLEPAHTLIDANAIDSNIVEPSEFIDSDGIDGEDMERVLTDIVENDIEFVENHLENLDQIRKNIQDEADWKVESIRLSLIFSALEDRKDILQNKDTALLASIGKRLTESITNGEVAFDSKVGDFIGLISRQMRKLEANTGSEFEFVLTEWEDKLISIIGKKEIKDGQRIEDEKEFDTLIQSDSTEESNALNDSALREIFIDELNQHAMVLKDASLNVYSDSEEQGGLQNLNEVWSKNLEQVTRVIHTLTGNFKNLGLNSIGDCFDEMGGSIQLITNDPDINQRLRLELDSLHQLLIDTMVEIQAHHSVTDSTIDRYRSITNQFNLLQLEATKALIPLDADSINGATQGSEPELDSLHQLLIDTMVEIQAHHSVTDSTIDRYRSTTNQFNLLQLEATKALIPLDADSINGATQGSEPELDFSIIDPDEEQEFDIHEETKNRAAVEPSEIEADLVTPVSIDGSSSVMIDEDTNELTEQLRQIFLEESESRLNTINGFLDNWRQNDCDEELLSGIRREFHTLKGSAASMGYDDVSRLSHVVESLLEQGNDHSTSNDSSLLNLLEEMHDGLASELGFIPNAGDGHLKSLISMVELLLAENSNISVDIKDEPYGPQEVYQISDVDQDLNEERDTGSTMQSKTDVEGAQEMGSGQDLNDVDKTYGDQEQQWTPPTDIPVTRMDSEMVDLGVGSLRIENKRLTELLNFSGEMGLTRTQLKTNIDGTRDELDVLRNSMNLIRNGLRDLEFEADSQMRSLPETREQALGDESFDPLQLDRYSRLQAKARDISHQLDSLTKVERRLSERASELGGTLNQQRHLGEQLQDGLMSARMISVSDYMPRLRQLVRDTSRRLDKSVEFFVDGGEIEVDKQVMDMMMAPFEHMVRNAIIHGIEATELRSEKNKPVVGQIRLDVVQQGSELLLNFSDDGNGVNREKLSQRALELGLVETVAEINEDHLLQIISQPGYSTEEEVSLVSGRGVGMDVVYQAVRSLGGSMALSSQPGKGTSFQFRLPVTLTISQALLVKVGAFRFGIITRMIERVMRVRDSQLEMIDGQQHVEVGEQHIPIINLADQLGEVSLSTEETYRSLIVIRLADRISAFEVDEFQETVEIVTKTPGSQLTSIEGVIGVTVLADTSIVLILDPGQFVDRAVLQSEVVPIYESSDLKDNRLEDIDVSTILRRILVVDDSLVVRKIMQRDIEGFGLEAVLAIDGINALEILKETWVDFVLIDLEMPRMNGYELIVKLREDPLFQDLPIIVITSRSGEMHRERAIGLGADGYLSKPYDDQNLMEMMESISLKKIVKY